MNATTTLLAKEGKRRATRDVDGVEPKCLAEIFSHRRRVVTEERNTHGNRKTIAEILQHVIEVLQITALRLAFRACFVVIIVVPIELAWLGYNIANTRLPTT